MNNSRNARQPITATSRTYRQELSDRADSYQLTPTEEAINEEAAFTPFMAFCGSYCPSCRGCVLEEALDPCRSLNSHLGNGSGDLGSALRREWTAADRAARAYRAAGYTDEHTIDGGA